MRENRRKPSNTANAAANTGSSAGKIAHARPAVQQKQQDDADALSEMKEESETTNSFLVAQQKNAGSKPALQAKTGGYGNTPVLQAKWNYVGDKNQWQEDEKNLYYSVDLDIMTDDFGNDSAVTAKIETAVWDAELKTVKAEEAQRQAYIAFRAVYQGLDVTGAGAEWENFVSASGVNISVNWHHILLHLRQYVDTSISGKPAHSFFPAGTSLATLRGYVQEAIDNFGSAGSEQGTLPTSQIPVTMAWDSGDEESLITFFPTRAAGHADRIDGPAVEALVYWLSIGG